MITPDSKGWVHGYYGSYNIREKKPKYGVHYMVLDEYVKRSIDREKDRFVREIESILDKFSKVQLSRMEKNSTDIREVKILCTDIREFIEDVVKVNELKKPKEKVKPRRSKKVKVKVDSEDDDMGYL